MKLELLQSNLREGLGRVAKGVTTRSILPICSNVLMATDEGRLRLVTTNLEQTYVTWIGAKIEEEGSVTVPFHLLFDFVSLLPAEWIDLHTTETGRLSLVCQGHRATLPTLSDKDFPPVPVVEGTESEINGTVFKQAVNAVHHAIATDESRPIMTAMNIGVKDKAVSFAGADGFMLAAFTTSIEGADAIANVPGRVLPDVVKLIEDKVKMVISADRILFRLDHTEVQSQLIQGTFPNYLLAIPQSYTTSATVNKAELLNTVQQACVFAHDGSEIVRFIIRDKLTISGRTETEDTESVIDLVETREGPEVKFACNGRYILGILNTIESKQVTLQVNSSSSPIGFKGDADTVQILMPMFVQW